MLSALRRLRFLPLLAALLLLFGACPVAAAPEDTAEMEAIELIGEENDIPRDVYYYNGQIQYTHTNYRPATEIFTWGVGRNDGTALVLDGKNQFLRLPTATLSELSSFTVSSWVYWNGGDVEDTSKGQKLLTLYDNEYHYLLVSLHAVDEADGLNGMMIEWATPGNDPQRVYTVTESSSSFAFPTNEWHHVAFTLSGNTATLYVDGHRHLSADTDIDITEMQPPKLRIGASFAATEQRLDARLQDTVLYTAALSDDQVLLSAQDGDPLSGQTATTTTDTLATRPSTSAVKVERDDEAVAGLIFGVPVGLVITLGSILAVVVVLSVVLSILGNRQKKEATE